MAYLELALANFDSGNYPAAQMALDEGADVAGSEHPYYYLEAAALLSDLEFWLLSAEMYFKLAQSNPRELAPEERDHAEMAVYLATNEPEARQLLNLLEEQEGVEAPFIDTLQARFQLLVIFFGLLSFGNFARSSQDRDHIAGFVTQEAGGYFNPDGGTILVVLLQF